jgi:hypothetical protein
VTDARQTARDLAKVTCRGACSQRKWRPAQSHWHHRPHPLPLAGRAHPAKLLRNRNNIRPDPDGSRRCLVCQCRGAAGVLVADVVWLKDSVLDRPVEELAGLEWEPVLGEK